MVNRPWIFWPVLFVGLVAASLAGVVLWEMRSSTLQARWLVPLAAELGWTVEPGPSAEIVFPGPGPYDLRLGYAWLPDMIEHADARGFSIDAQARVTPRFAELVSDFGLFPIYPAKTQAGLTVLGRQGETLFGQMYPQRVYPAFESIPPVVWQTLLFIENRTALDPDQPFRNPAVEWPRLVRSSFDLGLRAAGRDGSVAGASTLATQIEKFRHEPDGLTATPWDKLTQMASASLRTYLDGPETLPARRRIVLDYLNSVPLAAQRGEGEVTGLGDGLWAWYGRDFAQANRILASIPPGQGRAVPTPERVHPPGAPATSAFWEATDPLAEQAAPTVPTLELVRFTALDDWSGSRDASERGSGLDPDVTDQAPTLEDQGAAYREVLSLLLSQRRPSYYLTRFEGREALDALTDRYLDILEADGVLSPGLAGAARAARSEIRPTAPPRPSVSFIERKGVNAVRTQLLTLLGVPALYDLDRLDLTVRTTIDSPAQNAVTAFFQNLARPEFVQAHNLNSYRLLDRGDPGKVHYSFVLHELTDRGNLVRIQTDNLDAPFNLNESARLELGSTAKLRTLASYLEILADLHTGFSVIDTDSLRSLPFSQHDALTRWAREQLLAQPDLPLLEFLRRAMQRTYSASPSERFVTGGGVQTFSNFDNTFNHRSMSVTEAFRHSVNLVFVRMMRDVSNHYMYRVPGSVAHILDDPTEPLRQEYLARFADREGIQFLNQFLPKLVDKDRTEILNALVQDRRLSAQRVAWVYRAVAPDPSLEEFGYLLRFHQPEAEFSEAGLQDLYRRADPGTHTLADLGYLASVHPLELWLGRYLIENPDATRAEVVLESTDARQDVYRWLFRTSRQSAQDQRIRSLLEVEAFTEIHAGWQRLGYPFGNIVPSLGTSIGSSGDRPSALSELVGIILNDGMRLPTYRVEELSFARDTPFETRMTREGVAGTRVMEPEVAQVLREALVDVVEEGTARRMNRVLRGPDGAYLTVGAKTGTGDNRYRVFGPGGSLIESRSVNRTSTFVFFIDDRFYGVVTAYVPGQDADDYWFTSALPAQILRELAPVIEELVNVDADASAQL